MACPPARRERPCRASCGFRVRNRLRRIAWALVVSGALIASCHSAAIPSGAPTRRRSIASSSSANAPPLPGSTKARPGPATKLHFDQRGGGEGESSARKVATVPRGDKERTQQDRSLAPPAWIDGCKSALASALSAACVKTLLQPIDAVKTYQQYTHAASGSSVSLLKAIRAISAHGWGRFYAGLGVTVLGSMPGVAIYFGVYSYCKNRLLATDAGADHPTLSVAFSAALGNSVASFSRVPYEVVKQQLQTGTYASTWEALAAVVATSGKPRQALRLIFPRGGVAAQMWRDVPYAVVTLLLYETLQGRVKKRYGPPCNGDISEQRRRRKLLDFCVGGIAGGMGSWVTNPQDVIKTRLQTNSAAYGGSVASCAAALWNEGGPSAFLRGSVPRLLHKVPANAFFFLFYEGFRRVLRVTDAVPAPEQPTQQRRRAVAERAT
jgi:Mitochondrial carrier protein